MVATQPVDSRHQRRRQQMQALFAWTFQPTGSEAPQELASILDVLPTVDAQIQAAAQERPLKDINQVDLAILRLALAEHQLVATPPKVLIDEAVELAKEFGTENSPKFVNGVLAQVLQLKT
jgi:N utilization substance protein B